MRSEMWLASVNRQKLRVLSGKDGVLADVVKKRDSCPRPDSDFRFRQIARGRPGTCSRGGSQSSNSDGSPHKRCPAPITIHSTRTKTRSSIEMEVYFSLPSGVRYNTVGGFPCWGRKGCYMCKPGTRGCDPSKKDGMGGMCSKHLVLVKGKTHCPCFHGKGAAVEGYCKKNNCASCDEKEGYALHTLGEGDKKHGFCREKTCNCTDGTPEVGNKCPKIGEIKCAKCDSKYWHFNVTAKGCSPRPCTCDNGVAAKGKAGLCDKGADGKVKEACTSCNDGYYRNDEGVCKEKQCDCPHGTAAKGKGKTPKDGCIQSGSLQCTECEAGYHLIDYPAPNNTKLLRCARNVCVCDNGLPIKGPQCPK